MEERLSMAAGDSAEVLAETRNGIAILTLNRPAALNALTLSTIEALDAAFNRAAADPGVRLVVLRGAGEKAFCAGGDLRSLYESFRAATPLHREFFRAEYALDYRLYAYPKPLVALLDGITMGGGMGLAQASRWRLVGERTRIAMPEVGIGLFPDVGASHFLSRLAGALGTYLALTGVTLRAADAVYAGLADAYLPAAGFKALLDGFEREPWSDDAEQDLRRRVAACAGSPGAAPLASLRPAIEAHFSHPSVTAILAGLDTETRPAYRDWAAETAALMRTRSPTMLLVTLRELQRGKALSLSECFRMEAAMAERVFAQGDFIEGIRALIIDKDRSPRWRPAELAEVSEAAIGRFFD
jgi:enoyl-CoA hydratase/carnithine racemase